MDNVATKDELDVTFRLNVLNNIILKTLKECFNNSENPDVLLRINELAFKLEEKMYNKATNKDDYLAKIHHKLNMARGKTIKAQAATPSGNQQTQGQASHSNQSQQNLDNSSSLQQNIVLLPNEPQVVQKPLPTSLPNTQPNINQPNINQLQRNNQLEHQNTPRPVQQIRPMTEPSRFSNTQNYQNPQLMSQLVVSQEHSMHLPPGQLQRTNMPSTPLYAKTQITSSMAPSASTSRNTDFINSTEWHRILQQFQRARFTYVPELLKLQRRAEEQYFQAQNMKQLESAQHSRVVIQQMITFLHLSETDLRTTSKEIIIQCLNKIMQYFCSLSKRQMINAVNPVQQSSDGPTCLNSLQTAPSDYESSMKSSMISSRLVEIGSSNSQRSPLSVPVYDPLLAAKEVNVEFGSEGTPYKNTYLNAKQNLHPIQSVKASTSLHSMLPPMNKATPSTSYQQNSPGARSISDKLPQRVVAQTEENKNASSTSGSRPMSQPWPATLRVDSPSTPITPSSVPKEVIEKSSGLVSPMTIQASRMSCETNMGDKSLNFETPEAPTSSLPSCFGGSEGTQLSHDAKRPIERLIQAVQSISKGTLRSSMDDIASVINSMDKLPDYAYDVNPCGKMKRNIDYVTSDGSTWDNHASSRKKSRNEMNHDLLDEIGEINQSLIETVVEVEFDSQSSEGTVIKCTYKPVTCSELFKTHFTPILQATLSVKLLIPSSYPNSSPKIIDKLPVGCYKEGKDLLEKAKSGFDRCVRGLVSLREMVQAWDDYARSVFSDFALGLGGETFSSKYGTWECVSAA